MFIRSTIAIIAGLLCFVLTGAAGAVSDAVELASVTWRNDDPRFGGFSGLHVFDGGEGFLTVSDRGAIVEGTFLRKNGVLSGVKLGPLNVLQGTQGRALTGHRTDAEGLAVRKNGRIYVSFEGAHRVWTYRNPSSEAAWLPRHPDFKGMQNNSSLEALAIGPDNALYTIPERSGRLDRPFPVYRYKGKTWSKPFSIPRRGPFLVVGADIGPDGRFYVLERHLGSIFGFETRVRRFNMTAKGLTQEVTLIQTRPGVHDNLEGLSVWEDASGKLRLTMISDDNFRGFQKTELVEYSLPE
ncbi:MAG: esterase-like activity of phytase family protein [Pseudoruegeria sp.]